MRAQLLYATAVLAVGVAAALSDPLAPFSPLAPSWKLPISDDATVLGLFADTANASTVFMACTRCFDTEHTAIAKLSVTEGVQDVVRLSITCATMGFVAAEKLFVCAWATGILIGNFEGISIPTAVTEPACGPRCVATSTTSTARLLERPANCRWEAGRFGLGKCLGGGFCDGEGSESACNAAAARQIPAQVRGTVMNRSFSFTFSTVPEHWTYSLHLAGPFFTVCGSLSTACAYYDAINRNVKTLGSPQSMLYEANTFILLANSSISAYSDDFNLLWSVPFQATSEADARLMVDGTTLVVVYASTIYGYNMWSGIPMWQRSFVEVGAVASADGAVFATVVEKNGTTHVASISVATGEVFYRWSPWFTFGSISWMVTAGGMLVMYDESAHMIASTFPGPAPPPPPQPTNVTETLFLLSSTCGGQSAKLSYAPFDCNNDNNVSFAVACDNSTNQIIQSWFMNASCSGGVAKQQRYTPGKCYTDGAQSKVFSCPSQ